MAVTGDLLPNNHKDGNKIYFLVKPGQNPGLTICLGKAAFKKNKQPGDNGRHVFHVNLLEGTDLI
jgi:hypothetical protein